MLEGRPRWLPTLGAAVLAILTAILGQWQWGKAELKAARQAVYAEGGRQPVLAWREARALGPAATYRRVRVAGRFLGDYLVLLDNRVRAGRAGYHVLTPLALEGDGAVLVNRGWLAAAVDRRREPAVGTPAGPLELEGILVRAQGRYLELARDTGAGQVWQNLDLARYRAWLGVGETGLPDWLLMQTSPAADGLARDWPPPHLGLERHRAYAVQWYALCALTVGLWAYFVLVKRGRA